MFSFDWFPFETFAFLAGRTGSRGGGSDPSRLAWSCRQITGIRQRHQHRVSTHEIDPLKGLRIARCFARNVLQRDDISDGGHEPAVGDLQRYAPFAEVNDLEAPVGSHGGALILSVMDLVVV